MDYEHLYRYLRTRPLEEIEQCLDNVTKLVHEKSGSTNTATIPANKITQLEEEIHGLRISRRVWMEQAVWGTFGAVSPVTFISTEALSAATSKLMQLTTATSFVQSVNSIIVAEIKECGAAAPVEQNGRPSQPLTSSVNSHSHHILPNGELSEESSDQKEDIFSEWESASDEKSVSNDSGDDYFGFTTPEPPDSHKKRKLGKNSPNRRRLKWTEDMDDALLMAVAEHKSEGWEVVAGVMDRGLSGSQCYQRWQGYLLPQQQGLRKKSDFSAVEVLTSNH